jgi:hypothetical protein
VSNLTGRSPYDRVKPIRDEQFRREWMARQTHCQACGRTRREANYDVMPLTCHHIVKFGRSDEATNLLCLCQSCHDLAENRQIRVKGLVLLPLSLGNCLWLKRDRDKGEYDPVRLAQLYGRALPELEEV